MAVAHRAATRLPHLSRGNASAAAFAHCAATLPCVRGITPLSAGVLLAHIKISSWRLQDAQNMRLAARYAHRAWRDNAVAQRIANIAASLGSNINALLAAKTCRLLALKQHRRTSTSSPHLRDSAHLRRRKIRRLADVLLCCP